MMATEERSDVRVRGRSVIPASPDRVLIRGVNWLGDAVMTTPALVRLRERFPGAHVILATPEKLAGLWPGHPAVDTVMPLPARLSVFQTGRLMRRALADVAVIFPNSHRSVLEAWWARIPVRVGLSRPFRNGLLTHVVAPPVGDTRMRKRTEAEVIRLAGVGVGGGRDVGSGAPLHHSYLYLQLAWGVGGVREPVAPVLALDPQELVECRARWGLGLGGEPWVGLNAGAEYGPAKRWPAERFVASALALRARVRCRFVILGGSGDLPLAAELESCLRHGLAAEGGGELVRNTAGQTSLRELCGVLACCSVVLTNDSGPMHVAAAVGTPVVAIFGSTSRVLTGPGVPGDGRHALLEGHAPCAPCYLRRCPIDSRCLTSVGVAEVVEALVDRVGMVRRG